MTAEMMLRQAAAIIGDRRSQYGEPATFFEALAKRWSLTLGHQVTAQETIRCLIDLKAQRLAQNPKHRDSILDIAGYAAILDEVLTEAVHG